MAASGTAARKDGKDMDFAFRLHTLNRRWFNNTLLRRRNFDGHIVSMNQSGSHWIKNMLADVLAQRYNLPPLKHVQDDSIIGHPKSRPLYKNIPCLVHSHGFPHALTLALPFLHYPKYLVLARDMRDSLISHYARFKGDYGGATFTEFLQCKLGDKRMHSDIWSRMRFMNEWGRLIDRHPEAIAVLSYEDMQADAAGSLRKAVAFFKLEGITEAMVSRAVENATPEKMAQKPNPNVPTVVIRTGVKKPREEYFTPENQKYFEDICRRNLTHDFGYGYF